MSPGFLYYAVVIAFLISEVKNTDTSIAPALWEGWDPVKAGTGCILHTQMTADNAHSGPWPQHWRDELLRWDLP